MTTKIGMYGAMGRMGQVISGILLDTDGVELAAAIDRTSEQTGSDYGLILGRGDVGVTLVDEVPAGLDAIIDFSSPAGTKACVDACVQHGVAMVIGTTGLDDDTQAAIDAATSSIPVMQAANMSVGVNLLLQILPKVAQALGEAYDVEIVETHHRYKVDAPSGTANALAEVLADALDRNLASDAVHGRSGQVGARTDKEIGVFAVRGGDVIGIHDVHFHGFGESITINHTATSRDTFGRGAVRAAAFLAGKAPGRYTMQDVLQIDS